jgi:preprotein translocase subunit YajC
MFVTPAFAQTAQNAADTSGGSFALLLPYLLILPIGYFLLIRPQQKRLKEQQAAIAAVKKGDEVTTAGGIVGKVTKVDDALVEVEIASGVRVRVVKSTLAAIAPLGSKPAND